MKRSCHTLFVLTALPLIFGFPLTANDVVLPRDWQDQLEKEWLLEARLFAEPKSSSELRTSDDARGGCDGVTNGEWGFHTAVQIDPWWQVDLGDVHAISQVRLWNRSDTTEAARRASHFQLLVSVDGRAWSTAYEHDGTLFYGYRMPDRQSFGVPLKNIEARFVRIQLPGANCLHLDEVEVIGTGKERRNLALHQPADQSSLSQWSSYKPKRVDGETPDTLPLQWVAERGLKLAAERRASGIDTTRFEQLFAQYASANTLRPAGVEATKLSSDDVLSSSEREEGSLLTSVSTSQTDNGDNERNRALYFRLRSALRELSLTNPLLDFDEVLFVKRAPGSFSHMSDQNYGWWSRPGGGISIVRGLRSGIPSVECLTKNFSSEPGSYQRPALSYDGNKILFAWCKYYPELAEEKYKLNKANVPEDAFYHVFEMNRDGSDPRQLTHGKYDDFDAQYLPDGRIVFLSTRRGQLLQAGRQSAQRTWNIPDLPDCYVRCGGDASRPVAVYTLHTMAADGSDPVAISPFEMFEWDPSVAADGTIHYSRWDYVDRDNMPYMSLWSIRPDGTHSRLVYGNYTRAPHCTFEPRPIPGSRKILFTASGHHSQTMGSLVLLDPAAGTEGERPITRITPETPFPEIEGWPRAFYSNPWPLSEQTHLVSWGTEEQVKEGTQRSINSLGIYLFDVTGGRELLYRDPEISSMHPIPFRSRPRPPVLASDVDWDAAQEGRFLVADVYEGLKTVERGDIAQLRVIAIPAKTQPWMNQPTLGLTRDDPGKAVLGTVPVEPDGSAYFCVPSGVAVFFQALDQNGMAVQTMRSATHVQPGQTLSCVGCHERRDESPAAPSSLLALLRPASKITPGPEGSWPLRFDKLVQPLLNAQCVGCHHPQSEDVEAAKFDLTPDRAYESLVDHGEPSLREIVLEAYRIGVSTEGANPARRSGFLSTLTDPAGHHGVRLGKPDLDRLITWLDTYGQRQGHFSEEQENSLEELRTNAAGIQHSTGHIAQRRVP